MVINYNGIHFGYVHTAESGYLQCSLQPANSDGIVSGPHCFSDTLINPGNRYEVQPLCSRGYKDELDLPLALLPGFQCGDVVLCLGNTFQGACDSACPAFMF